MGYFSYFIPQDYNLYKRFPIHESWTLWYPYLFDSILYSIYSYYCNVVTVNESDK